MSKSYTVTAATGLALPPMTPVKLTDAQLKLRRHQVTKAKRGFHVSADALTFKRGEIVEIDGALPKALATAVDQDGAPTPAADQTLADQTLADQTLADQTLV